MKTWNERITYAREQAGLEKAEFARRVGVKAPTVTDWESGGIKNLSAENLISISTVTGFNPKWLQTGTGPMRPASHVGPAIPADRPIPSSFRSETKAPLPPTGLETPQAIEIEADHPDYAHIRRARIRLSAGVTGYAIEWDNGFDSPTIYRRDWLAARGLKPDRLIVMRVSGSSMEPGLHDGDSIVVNLDDTHPKDGKVFAIDYEGELVVKRLRRDQGLWFLASDNADKRWYPDKTLSEGVSLIGRVIQKQSENI